MVKPSSSVISQSEEKRKTFCMLFLRLQPPCFLSSETLGQSFHPSGLELNMATQSPCLDPDNI